MMAILKFSLQSLAQKIQTFIKDLDKSFLALVAFVDLCQYYLYNERNC